MTTRKRVERASMTVLIAFLGSCVIGAIIAPFNKSVEAQAKTNAAWAQAKAMNKASFDRWWNSPTKQLVLVCQSKGSESVCHFDWC
jgi:hypothetical protein